jgi:hypothetical protein
MNVSPITMTKADALAAFREYQAAVRADRGSTRKVWKAEDVALMQAYKHLARGTAVIDLQAAMTQAGSKLFDGCPIPLPCLAIVASDAPECFLELEVDGAARFSTSKWATGRKKVTRFPARTFPIAPDDRREFWRQSSQVTMTPIIPPQLRPKHDLAGYRTLWEVEAWKKEPPKDPMLLKPLGGMLYAVLATWDLTEMERAVLRGRISR